MFEKINGMEIAELVRGKPKISKSLFGKGKISKFRKEDKLRLHEL